MTIKGLLATAPVLQCPDFTVPFTLQTDVSVELGVVLTQEIDQVVAYGRALRPAERNYSATEKQWP